jgi:hypothetical protein
VYCAQSFTDTELLLTRDTPAKEESPMEPEMPRTTGGDAPGVSVPPPHIVEQLRKQPECRLLWAVLQEAMETYMKYASAINPRDRRFFAEAEQWVMDNDPTWLFSFVSICHVLELNPDYLRAGLQRWRATSRAAEIRRAA